MDYGQQTPNEQSEFPNAPRAGRFDILVKTLAVVGLISILGLAGWGVVNVAQVVPSALSNLAAGVVSITSQFFPADEENGDNTPATSTPSGDTDTSGDANGDTGDGTAQTPRSPGTETSSTSTPRQLRPSGRSGEADLSARIIETGIIDPDTEAFVATSTFHATDEVAVRFAVENVGGGTSDTWMFNAVLPTTPVHIYDSNEQRVLEPGDRIEYTLQFDRVSKTPRYFVINIDPRGRLNDARSDNNIAREELVATSTPRTTQ